LAFLRPYVQFLKPSTLSNLFAIVIPMHNEAQHIIACLDSLWAQSCQSFDILIVNDGSSDQSPQLVKAWMQGKTRVNMVDLPASQHAPGAKVVHSFYHGWQAMQAEKYAFVCKFDADIIFPPDYLARLLAHFEASPKTGMLSGLVYIQNSQKQWVFEALSSKNHVRGPIKCYRRQCFDDMQGLRACLGWDNIDVMLAQKHGWQVQTIKDLWVKHLRPTAYAYRAQKAQKLGLYFYNLGLDWPLCLVSALKSAYKERSIGHFLSILRSYAQQRKIAAPKALTADEIKYIRNLRYAQFTQKIAFWQSKTS
jgi:cellulose synthase/poly-beta-1,6-N-acetylglucosamine synthase-like glycosyltransferase